MESEVDNFLKVLQNKQRNLTKKLDRIQKKKQELKTSNKELKEEEKKLLESAPQVEELLQETNKLVEQYQKHLESSQKEVKKPQAKPEEDKTKEIVHLWVLGEFFNNVGVKEKFLSEHPNKQDLDAFLLFHSQAKGQANETLAEIAAFLEKSIELYLAKSDKIAPGTMQTYKKISEFAAKALSWSLHQILPSVSTKKELSITSDHVYSSQLIQSKEKVEEEPEIKQEKEEIKVEVSEKIEPKQEKEVVKPQVVATSKWAEEEEEDKDDEWGENNAEPNEKSNSKGQEDEGFIEVTKKKPKKPQPGESQGPQRRGRGRGRGRRYENRGGRVN